MNLFLPEIGTKLLLTKDWTFVLYSERRNLSMLKAIGQSYSYNGKNFIVTIPKGTIVVSDRIYIRKGCSNYSSVTFTIPKLLNKKNPFAGTRFWTKLSDVNKIEFEFVSCNEDTLNLIKNIDEKTKTVLSSIEQSRFMKILLDNKTVNNIRPQEQPSHFIMRVDDAMKEFLSGRNYLDRSVQQETKNNLEKALIVFIRAHKIASLPTETEE